jgi:tetratricopeptide (TPR) repeat protein
VVAVQSDAAPGSGYVIAPGLVITSAHVVTDMGTTVDLFTPGSTSRYQGKVIWRGTPGGRDDAALVHVDMPLGAGVANVRWGRVVTYQPETKCQTWGLPDVVQSPGRPAETAQLSGTLNPGYGYVSDRYVMTLRQQGAAPKNGGSPWGGMSGAALFCDDLLTGVVATDPADRNHSQLEAVPSYLLLLDPGFRAAITTHSEISAEALVLEPVEWQEFADFAQSTMAAGRPTSPAALLSPYRQVVPFRGRSDLLRELATWAGQPGLGALLLHGPGGQGKTRLAQQFATEMRQQRWVTLWLRPVTQNVNWRALRDRAVPALLILDYAEGRREQLDALLDELSRDVGDPQVKVLLLARTDADWWEEAQAESTVAGEVLSAAPVVELPALEPDPSGRAEAYREAVESFARELANVPGLMGQDWPTLAKRLPSSTAENESLDMALALHMAALADLLDAGSGSEVSSDDAARADSGPIEDRVLVHERHYWHTTADARGLLATLSFDCLVDAMAAAFLLGAPDRGMADKVLRRVSGLSGQQRGLRDKTRDWIASLYPPPVRQPWGLLQPDRLVERFIGLHIQRDPDFTNKLAASAKKEQVKRFLSLLSRATAHPSFRGALDETLTALCVRFPEFSLAAVAAVVQAEHSGPLREAIRQIIEDPKTPAKRLTDLNDALPLRSHTLASLAMQSAQRVVDVYRDRADKTPMALGELISALNNLAVRLSDMGHRQEALEASSEAVNRYRKATVSSRAADPDFAALLAGHATRLGDLGYWSEATKTNEEAVKIFRRLVSRNPKEYVPMLGMALNNLSVELLEFGKVADAAEASGETVKIVRALADAESERYRPSLASALHNHSRNLGALGRHEEALESIVEAIAILRDLAESQPDAYLGQLALTINSYANCQGNLGFRQKALEGVAEASEIYRRLADSQPDRYLSNLAGTLVNLAGELLGLGRGREALVPSREAVEIYREMAATLPNAHLPDLAMSLEVHATCLTSTGHRRQGFDAASEALTIRRMVAKSSADAGLPALAVSLNNFAINLAEIGRIQDALESMTEAVDVRRKLAAKTPLAYLSDLAITLTGYCTILKTLHRDEEALDAISEATNCYLDLDRRRPNLWQDDLDRCEEIKQELISRINSPSRNQNAAVKVIRIRPPRIVYLRLAFYVVILGLAVAFLVTSA